MSFVMPTSPSHPSKSVAVPLQRLLRYNIHAKGAKGVQPEETGVKVRSPRCWVLGGKIPFRLPNPPLLPLPGKSRKLLETHDRMTANPNCSAVPRVPATSLPGRPHPTFLDPGSCVGVVWQRHGRGGGSSISFLGGWGGGAALGITCRVRTEEKHQPLRLASKRNPGGVGWGGGTAPQDHGAARAGAKSWNQGRQTGYPSA